MKMSLLLRASGDYVPNTLPGEIWQCDVRLALVFGTIDDIGVLPDNWTPEPNPYSRVEADWTINGNWTANVGLNQFQPDDYLNDQAAPAWTDFMAAAHLSNQVRLRSLELYPIGSPTGHVVPAAGFSQGTPATLTWTSSYPTGGESGTQLPPQNSIAVSWKTQQVGARGRGRIFLPSSTSAALSQAHVSSGAQSDIATAGAQFINALSYAGTGGTSAHVAPIVTGSPFENYGRIIQVGVGSIMDTQRRRRNRLTETYVYEMV
jgi:hypothetical protein